MIDKRYDENTTFHKYFQITDNLMLENLSSGIGFGPINSPSIPSRILEIEEYNVINWSLIDPELEFLTKHHEIANNLTNIAVEIVEPLFLEFKEDLQIKMAYRNILDSRRDLVRNKKPKSVVAESIDITLPSIEGNIFPLAKEFAKILKGNFDDMGLIFNNSSWITITNIGPNNVSGERENRGRTWSWDMPNGSVSEGFFPFRGLQYNDQASFIDYKRSGKKMEIDSTTGEVLNDDNDPDLKQKITELGDTVIDRS